MENNRYARAPRIAFRARGRAAAGVALALVTFGLMLARPAAAQRPAPPPTVTVLPGDTLAAIALRYYGAADEAARIAAANRLADPNRLAAGMELALPPAGVAVAASQAAVRRTLVAPGDTLASLAERAYGSVLYADALARANGITDADLIRPGDTIVFPALAPAASAAPAVPVAPAAPSPTSAAMRTRGLRHVCLDAGHGGKDIGAAFAFPDGQILREGDATLDIARSVAARLRAQGFVVTMTRQADVDVALAERGLLCNAAGAELHVSIHLNGVSDQAVNGSLALYAVPADRRLAELMAGALQSGLFGSRGDVISFGADLFHGRVMIFSRMPAVLVEPVFLTNPVEARALLTPAAVAGSRRAQIAAAIERGVLAYASTRE